MSLKQYQRFPFDRAVVKFPTIEMYEKPVPNYSYIDNWPLRLLVRCSLSNDLYSQQYVNIPLAIYQAYLIRKEYTWADIMDVIDEIIQVESFTPTSYWHRALELYRERPSTFTTPINNIVNVINLCRDIFESFLTTEQSHNTLLDIVGDSFKYLVDLDEVAFKVSHRHFKIGNGKIIDRLEKIIPNHYLQGKLGGRNILNRVVADDQLMHHSHYEDYVAGSPVLSTLIEFERKDNRFDSILKSTMLATYLHYKAKQLFKDGLWVNASCGELVFIHTHSFIDHMVNNLSDFTINWDVHPKDWFANVLCEMADMQLVKYATVKPERYRLRIDNPRISELVAGNQLRRTGAFMKHCIGGEDYIDGLNSPLHHYIQFGNSNDPKECATMHIVQNRIQQIVGYRNQMITEEHPMYDQIQEFIKDKQLIDTINLPQPIPELPTMSIRRAMLEVKAMLPRI